MASDEQSQKVKEISMEQRMQNRERQRRYRERKRQAAISIKASETKEQMPLPAPQSPTAPSLPVKAAAVPPRRNWKKEARMAHLNKKVSDVVLALYAPQVSRSGSSKPKAKKENSPNPQAHKDWKAAASNKNKEEAKRSTL